ncbi:MAG TPA: hypothetical protein VL727_16120 [Puia sp.]|jgi:hypothetical protein|nr:hypothetical protein [Puia sp.]
MENSQEQSLLQMNLDYDGGHILHETVRWSRFLSIVGIIAISLMVLVLALAGTALAAVLPALASGLEALAGLGTSIVVLIFLVIFAILGFTVFMLYRFSVLTRRGIDRQDQAAFTEGIKCLKIYFIIGGIFAILGLLGNFASLVSIFLLTRIHP